MARAFTLARGVVRMVGPMANTLVVGRLNADGDRIFPVDGDPSLSELGVPVEPYTVTYNTGFEDARGRDIFTGDVLDVSVDAQTLNFKAASPYTVFFDEGEGAFKVYAEGVIEDITVDGTGLVFLGQKIGVLHVPLTAESASRARVTGHFYEAMYGIAPDLEPEAEIDSEVEDADADAEVELDGDSYADDLKTLPAYDAGTGGES